MANVAETSVEIAHLYLKANQFSANLELAFDVARRWAPLVLLKPDGSRLEGVTSVVFLDDYSEDGSKSVPVDEAVPQVIEAAAKAGVPLDYICCESACVPTTRTLLQHFEAPPLDGQGSFAKSSPRDLAFSFERGLWHSDRPSQFDPDPNTDLGEELGAPSRTLARRRDVEIAVRLYQPIRGSQEADWTCPAVAAWWQLIRLGALLDFDPANETGLPEGSRIVGDAKKVPPFVAKRTLSLLSPRYIGVEHAVCGIISNVRVWPGLRKRIQLSSGEAPDRFELLSRISYIFAA